MLQGHVIFVSFLIMFVGIFAQQSVQNVSSSVNNMNNNVNQALPAFNPMLNVRLSTLASSPECKADIQKYCIKVSGRLIGNLEVLKCIDDLDNAVNLISKECQNTIYKYKYNMTRNVNFDSAAMRLCSKDIKLLEDCNDHTDERGTGRLITCLYDLFDNITEPSCRNFITQIQTTVFTDWRLSESFTTGCIGDIAQLQCGRLDDDNETLPHDQGAVLSCLSKNSNKLSPICLKHISRLTEMQSDDYHLDRALYYACRDDRERFCGQVTSGNGRVYRCLYEQKFNRMMSSACREEVDRRQKSIVGNALLDAPFVRICKSEMLEHQCVANLQDPNKKLTLINLLLCLESRLKTGSQINDGCRREMLLHRRMLMSDYALSPTITSKCRDEMVQHCSPLFQQGASGTIEQRGGRMIHCLFKAARHEKNFSVECLTSIKSFVRAVDPGSDIRADPLLETTCQPVIDALCSKVKPGDSNVIMCLLDNLKSTRMTDECEDRLMEVSYFMLRDWRITPLLLATCRPNLISLCDLPQNWSMSTEMTDAEAGNYLSCLYRQKNKLNGACRTELIRIMRIRSQSIGLMPEIEDNCITDLATCKNPEVKGEEMKCLQKKYNKLEGKCKSAVRNFTAMAMANPTLDFSLVKACEPMIQLFCPNIETGKENDLLRCLITQKNSQKMDYRCKVGIEHHQIISMKDEAFLSDQFRKKCTQEINQHCANRKTKSAVIQCLANKMLQDVLKRTNELTIECREELKFELLQRSETIDLDPGLAKVCQMDIRRLCPNKSPGNAQILDCLKANRDKVSPVCYKKLYQREKVDVILPDNDYSLTKNCAPVIQEFCANENKQNLLSCLQNYVNRASTSAICRTILYHRLMILNTDARFNKALIETCQHDINKHCQDQIIDNDDDDDGGDDDDDNDKDDDNDNDVPQDENDDNLVDHDMGGRIIGCLRTQYADKNVELESNCLRELVDVIHRSKLDVQLDAKLYQNCKNILQAKCLGIEKEDCLKVLYQKKQLNDPLCQQEVIRIIKEGQVDVYVDETLTISCQPDILKYCNDIPMGGGKQLQCLLKIKKSLTSSCQKVLLQRQELWRSISDIDTINDLTEHIVKSSNSRHIFSIILAFIICIFLAGCICRSCFRQRRVSKYH